MIPLHLLQGPPVQTQVATTLPPIVDALVKAKDWAKLADLFETFPPRLRGDHYEIWTQALNRAQRWERLVEVCDALMPQIEAKTGPRLASYRLYRAQGLSQLGRHAEAMAAHGENGRLGYMDGYSNACVEARLCGDWAAMTAFSEALLKAQPAHAGGKAWKGEALARTGDLVRAEPLLRAALEADPKLPFAWSNLGLCRNEAKAWTEALEACDRALALDPGMLEARYNRGRAHFELKRYAESRDDFRSALAGNPEDPNLKENLRQAERYLAAETKGKRAPASR